MGSTARPESKALQRAREWAAGRLIQLGLADGGDGSSAKGSLEQGASHEVATNTIGSHHSPRKSGRSPKRALDIAAIPGASSNDEPPLKRRRGRPSTIAAQQTSGGGINNNNNGLQR